MKKFLSVSVWLVLLIWSAIGADSAGLWAKYIAADGSYSFHYPVGWKVNPEESMVAIENSRTDEEMMMAGVPFDKRKSPADLASGYITLLRENNLDIRASNWQSDPSTKDSQVMFDLVAKNDGKQYKGQGFVIKTEQQATWFSYTAPSAGYSSARGLAILQGFIGSLASGSASKMPEIDYTSDPMAKIDGNAQAFLFVLEFALGAPLTKAQEDLILEELERGWRTMPEMELRKYDQYPALVQSILKMGQKDLEALRAELEKTIREWLDESDPSDKGVKAIRDQLKTRGRIVMPGEPPLTEMSLAAYSEIIAFSRLLRENSKALPEQITLRSVQEIKKQVQKSWSSFTKKEQQEIATAPGLWICLRVLLRNGSKEEQQKVRNQLLKLSADTPSVDANTNDDSRNNDSKNQNAPMDFATHNSLMAMQQMTFNSYMWSRGFNYQPSTGMMW
ncbi:MAG TPA: hypothetical protein VHY08_20480 [Bacillota bacterium]|nr:hypothetical protein [Bacillota bacterium]